MKTVDDQEQQDILDGLEKLSAAFFEKLPVRLSDIIQYFDEHIAEKNENVDALYELHRLVHSLAGTAGTYGYTKIGQRLQGLDGRLKELSHSLTISFNSESKKIIRRELVSIGDVIQVLREKSRLQ